ncbi:MAG: hypothetical protein D6732_06850 [Methanobacteriota archaeon]|nr:MAG: hypothetical protein D6732_06850 [Euryarchaeota archaeon]
MAMIFKQELIAKEEEDFKRLKLAPEQRAIVEQMADVLNQYLSFSKLATMGFIWKAVRDWQVRYSRSIAELSTSTPEDRIRSVREMTDGLASYLIKVLKRTTDEEQVRKACDSMYNFYVQNFSTR